MEGKKISFGFKKTKKIEKVIVEEKKDFIECVEEKAIKVVGGDEVKEETPLVIPMKPNTLVTTERLKEIAEKVESAFEEPEKAEEPPPLQKNIPENETLEQMAIRELLEDSKKAVKVETQELTLSLPAKSVSSGEKESTLDDYESVPIQEFGLAMLRGMGWTKNNEKSTFKQPQLRAKGLGLGADKVVKDNQKQKGTRDNRDEELTIVKNAYVKITSGKYSGYYGKVLSLDEDTGRVLVEIEVKKVTTSLSEFMMIPVSKSEYTTESKVINANSFEQYKKGEIGQKSSNNSEKDSSRNTERNNREEKPRQRTGNSSRQNNNDRQTERENYRGDKEINRDRSNREKRRDSSEQKSSQVRSHSSKTNKKYSSNESLFSVSDSETKKHKKKEIRSKHYSSAESLDSISDTERRSRKKERARINSDLEMDQRSKITEKKLRRDSSDSDDHRRSKRSDTPEGKRDIDKKRKGKKKKRDRDRSPNYRKHRK